MKDEKDEIKEATEQFLQSLPEPLLSHLFDTFQECLLGNLLEAYHRAVKEVKTDKRKTPEARREKLKKLLTPISLLNKAISISFARLKNGKLLIKENPYTYNLPDGTSLYPFVDLHIDLRNDIDVSRLNYDETSYHVPYIKRDAQGRCMVCGDGILHRGWSTEEIWHKEVRCTWYKSDGIDKLPPEEQYEIQEETLEDKLKGLNYPLLKEGKHSLWDLYEWWLPNLKRETVTSKDLLDRILFIYTIKRALNGDERAIDKLYSLYEDAAIGTAVNMAKRRKLLFYANDIKQEAKILLRLIISGFSPEILVKILLKEEAPHYLPIPKWIESFYIWYYSEYVPGRIQEFIDNPWTHPFGLEAFYIPMLLNPHTPIKDRTQWKKPTGKLWRKFNSFSFSPKKKTNLTTWLFGSKQNFHMDGRFCQSINDYVLKRYDKIRNEIKLDYLDEKESIEIPASVNLKTGFVCKECKKNVLAFKEPKTCEEHKNPKIPGQIKEKKRRQVQIGDFEMEKAKKEMIKSGIFRRNVEKSIDIVLQKIQGHSYSEIAKASGISRRQVINICNKVKNS